jgi:hypothetical protein
MEVWAVSEQKETPRTDALEARAMKVEAKLEKIEALLYEERARQREQQVQIDHINASNSKLHQNIGRWVERVVLLGVAFAGWIWERIHDGIGS